MAIGGRFIYSRSLLKLDKADLNLGGEDSDLNFEVNDYYSLRHSYSVAVIWRQFFRGTHQNASRSSTKAAVRRRHCRRASPRIPR